MENREKQKSAIKVLGATGRILLSVLKNLGEASLEVIDEGFLNPNYPFTKPTRILLGLDSAGFQSIRQKSNKVRRNLFSVTLHRLKKDGLVQMEGGKGNAAWFLTDKGVRILDAKTRLENSVLRQKLTKDNLPPVDGKFRIMSFDVPEKERWKRDYLRSQLIFCDYKMLQRSVWIGKRPLPEIFFKEVKKMSMYDYIHIFEIPQKGTVRNVKI